MFLGVYKIYLWLIGLFGVYKAKSGCIEFGVGSDEYQPASIVQCNGHSIIVQYINMPKSNEEILSFLTGDRMWIIKAKPEESTGKRRPARFTSFWTMSFDIPPYYITSVLTIFNFALSLIYPVYSIMPVSLLN